MQICVTSVFGGVHYQNAFDLLQIRVSDLETAVAKKKREMLSGGE
jgi:hypothetical protein